MRVRIKVKNRIRRRSWRVDARYWAAISSLAAYSSAGVPLAAPGKAQSQGSATGSATSQQARPGANQFQIPSGPLDSVLTAFGNATGLRITIANEGIRTLQSPGIIGRLDAEEALQRLLRGTGVSYRFSGTGGVTLDLSQVRTSIEVTERITTIASPKYTEPLRDLPQTISVIPRTVIEQQGATTLTDVLRNVPGLTIAAGEGGVPAGDNLTMRGFSARNDVFVDGVRDLGPQSRDPFNFEQVEVVKGPQSAYTGRGSTGGSINLVSKAPNLNRYLGGSVSLGNAGMRRFTGDVNAPLGRTGLGERTAFRMNAMHHDAGVPGRNEAGNQRTGFAPSLLFGSGRPTRLTLSYFRVTQDNLPDYGIPWVTATNNALAEYRDQPAPVPRETFYGLRSRDKEEIGSQLGTVRFEHDFSDSLNFRSQLRFGRSTRDSITTAPRFASDDSTVINRNNPNWYTNDKIWDNQTDLRARFETGSVEHSVSTGMNLTREDNVRKSRTFTAAPQTTLLNPNPDDPYNGTVTFNPVFGDATANSQAFYAFDTVKLHGKFQVNGGFRWDRFDVDGVNTNGTPLVRTDKMVSVRAGAVYKPKREGSFYVSYGTSLNPSLEGLTYQPANTTTDPEKTYTVEGGTKWDIANSRLLLSAAVFNVRKTNARTPGVLPDDPPQVLDGVQRVNGLELGVTGYITGKWMMFGAYTLMDGEIVESNTAAEVGRTFQNTPKSSVSLWSTYSAGKFTTGGGIRYAGMRYGNNTNTRQVDSYWTLDGMASYSVAKQLDLRLNLYNLNNAYYFERLGGGHLIPGPARMVMVTSSFRF